ncbi:hypothetical protein RUM44_010027 [Polyplax serrata]|uniref:Uncharacterized protein n=1 Tax=Polyplax serrata TaxID=468196 RepID=A0ABR1AUE7_POLSC
MGRIPAKTAKQKTRFLMPLDGDSTGNHHKIMADSTKKRKPNRPTGVTHKTEDGAPSGYQRSNLNGRPHEEPKTVRNLPGRRLRQGKCGE